MFSKVKQLYQDYLRGRQIAYCQVFKTDSVSVQAVLKDLAKFCRADQSTFHENERVHSVLEGRREVWLRIMTHINMPSHEFLRKYGGKEEYEQYTDN